LGEVRIGILAFAAGFNPKAEESAVERIRFQTKR
jgi:hypothetical protein